MNVPFYANIQEAASDDKSHVKFLTSALKGMSPTFEDEVTLLTNI